MVRRYPKRINLGENMSTPDTSQTVAEAIKKMLNSPQAELIEWLISFSLAYVIVENFGELVTAGSNVLGIAKSLLAVPV